jgi:transglutaminase-like putative cysteine protease
VSPPEAIRSPGLPETTTGYLGPTEFLDCGHPAVLAFVDEAVRGANGEHERAVRLFYAVRDRIRYDPYRIRLEPQTYRASRVVADGYGWCVPKAVLLAACARAVGIPSAIGLADVVNHLNTDKLRSRMGGVDIFYDHGYTALFVEGRWLKVVPAFNIELCRRLGVRPTDFDGTADALYQEFDVHDRRHMQYLADHGTWSDLPLAQICADFERHYPTMVRDMLTRGASIDGRFEDDAGS